MCGRVSFKVDTGEAFYSPFAVELLETEPVVAQPPRYPSSAFNSLSFLAKNFKY